MPQLAPDWRRGIIHKCHIAWRAGIRIDRRWRGFSRRFCSFLLAREIALGAITLGWGAKPRRSIYTGTFGAGLLEFGVFHTITRYRLDGTRTSQRGSRNVFQ